MSAKIVGVGKVVAAASIVADEGDNDLLVESALVACTEHGLVIYLGAAPMLILT